MNLIGEHTDYNGLPVLPMALQREVVLWGRPRDDARVRLINRDATYPGVEFELSTRIAPSASGSWGNYAKAPVQELVGRFGASRGFDALVDATLPAASGLSSSSALVNAVGLALATVHDLEIDLEELGPIMADAEQYVGTRGGGMDQAISLGARAGCAALISFEPLRLQHVPLPDAWRIVVAHSGVRAEKSGPAREAYNLRRAECEEALELVVGHLVAGGALESGGAGYRELLNVVEPGAIERAAADVLSGSLIRRFRHVVSEASRVADAVSCIRARDLAGFGRLMDASHLSLRDDFTVSTAELDTLVAIAREAGAAGARLTGAGFGGSIVALTDERRVDVVLETLAREYYGARSEARRIDDHLFVARPSSGASVERLST